MISIIMAPGERGTPRHLVLAEYIADHPGEYDFSFGEVEVDLLFSADWIGGPVVRCMEEAEARYIRKYRAVELKMPADFAQSLRNGHLNAQRRNCPYPLQVAVLGSLGDVLRALPTVTEKGWRNPDERKRAEGKLRRDIAALKASDVDVMLGISPLDLKTFTHHSENADLEAMTENMAQVVREARAYLESNIYLPLPKAESFQQYCMMGFPGIGPKKADDLIGGGWRLELIEGEPVKGVGAKTIDVMRKSIQK